MKKLFVFVLFVVLFSSCTENSMVKHYGGKSTLNLDKGKKLVNVTWKDQELWTLTKPMKDSDVAETYYFKEKSSFGVLEGEYVIIESK